MGIMGKTQGVASEMAPMVIASHRKGQKPLSRAFWTSASVPAGVPVDGGEVEAAADCGAVAGDTAVTGSIAFGGAAPPPSPRQAAEPRS